MSKNNLELRAVDDLVYLNYWDSMHGEDIVFELQEDGTVVADERTVDLVAELRELAVRLRTKAVEE